MSTRSLRQLLPAAASSILLRPTRIGLSDQPEQPSLWELDRFVDEVEQVRQALVSSETTSSSTASRGVAFSPWSTPSLPRDLRGLVISNMMSSAPAYNDYARRVLMPEMDQAALAEIQALEALATSRTLAIPTVE